MDFANEHYIRVYTRDTTTWQRLGWDGQCVLVQLLRKMDAAGVLDIEDVEPWEAAVIHCRAPEDVARRGMARCLELGVLVHNRGSLVAPKYVEANTASKSDKQRQRESRTQRRAVALSRNVTTATGTVTNGHEQTEAVTDRHDRSLSSSPIAFANAVQCVADARAHDVSTDSEADPTGHTTAAIDRRIRLGYERRYIAALAASPPTTRGIAESREGVVRWVLETALVRQASPEIVADQLLDGFFANARAAQNGFKLSWLAQNPLEYLGNGKSLGAQATAAAKTPAQREWDAACAAGDAAQKQHPGKDWDSPELAPHKERLAAAREALAAEREQRERLS